MNNKTNGFAVLRGRGLGKRLAPIGLALYVVLLVDNCTSTLLDKLVAAAGLVARWAHDGGVLRRLVIVVCLVLFGLGFRWYRARGLRLFGTFEIAFALAAVWLALSRAVSAEVAFATLTGALYVVVRGLDNLMADVEEKRAA
jgi:hypothetical protein